MLEAAAEQGVRRVALKLGNELGLDLLTVLPSAIVGPQHHSPNADDGCFAAGVEQ